MKKKKLETLGVQAEIRILVKVHQYSNFFLYKKCELDKSVAEIKKLSATAYTRCQQREGNDSVYSGTAVSARVISSWDSNI